MTSILLCVLAFALSFYLGRKSIVSGLVAVLGFGYTYGILRANLAQSASHFIFDAAVVGFCMAQLSQTLNQIKHAKGRKLILWFFVLMAWPLCLFLFPVQDRLIELVGLRGSIFLLPFLVMGARMTNEEMYRLAVWIAPLNLAAFAVAVAEFFFGIERFIPQRTGVTTIVYMSGDLAGYTAFRIPSMFTSSHAYGGTMVITLPLLVGAWSQRHKHKWVGNLLATGMVAAIVGVFMAAARTHAVVLFVLLVVTTLSGRLKIAPQFGWLILLLGIGWVVSKEERLQRFTSLSDTDAVSERIRGSVNERFSALAAKYPMGNGLGGGGTSIPYFLQDRIRNPVGMESEYARIMLEQGIPGLCLWIVFLMWALLRRANPRSNPWALGRLLAWFACVIYFFTGLIGVGLLTSIPQTCLLLLFTGWVAGGKLEPIENWLVAQNNSRSNQAGFLRQPELSLPR